MPESHESLAAGALEATKNLHAMLRAGSGTRAFSSEELLQMRTLAKTANGAVASMRRHHGLALQEAGVKEALLREALHGELLDRQARGARLEERYRTLSDAKNGDSPIDAARRATGTLDQSLATLCSHHSPASSETHQMWQMGAAAAAPS